MHLQAVHGGAEEFADRSDRERFRRRGGLTCKTILSVLDDSFHLTEDRQRAIAVSSRALGVARLLRWVVFVMVWEV